MNLALRKGIQRKSLESSKIRKLFAVEERTNRLVAQLNQAFKGTQLALKLKEKLDVCKKTQLNSSKSLCPEFFDLIDLSIQIMQNSTKYNASLLSELKITVDYITGDLKRRNYSNYRYLALYRTKNKLMKKTR